MQLIVRTRLADFGVEDQGSQELIFDFQMKDWTTCERVVRVLESKSRVQEMCFVNVEYTILYVRRPGAGIQEI